MSFKGTLHGNLGETPQVRYTQTGKPVLDLNVAATPRRADKETGEWFDDGDSVWVRVSLWGDQAEELAPHLHKGSRVTLAGELARDTYTRRDGSTGESLRLTNATFLGIRPARERNTVPAAPAAPSGPAIDGGFSGGDPWAVGGGVPSSGASGAGGWPVSEPAF